MQEKNYLKKLLSVLLSNNSSSPRYDATEAPSSGCYQKSIRVSPLERNSAPYFRFWRWGSETGVLRVCSFLNFRKKVEDSVHCWAKETSV